MTHRLNMIVGYIAYHVYMHTPHSLILLKYAGYYAFDTTEEI